MAKDYFQDITPPASAPNVATPVSVRKVEPTVDESETSPRSIRDIAVSRSRPRIDESPRPSASFQDAPVRSSKLLLWILAGVLLVVLAVLGVFFFRKTLVTITPRSHTVTFSDTARITALPEGSEVSGLVYAVAEHTYEDSATLPAGSITKVEEYAHGSLTVSNSFSATPVPLLKNTRFENSAGLVFRVKEAITVPGKKGNAPGTITISVVADKPGELYNIPATSFTLPGLKGTSDMFTGITAKSATSFGGGFVGEKPSVDEKALETTRADIRKRLLETARASLATESGSSTSFIFPELLVISYESKPITTENAVAKIVEVARVSYPTFPKNTFASVVGTTVSADTEGSEVSFIPAGDFVVRPEGELKTLSEPLTLMLAGTGRLLWHVDSAMVASSIAGKNVASFEEIIKGIKSVQEARTRPQPFWSSTFPTDPGRINVVVSDPLAQ